MVKTNNRKETKKAKALRLFEQFNKKTRKELVNIFVKELKTSEGSARTHLSWCMKEFSSKSQYSHLKYDKRKIDKSGLKREKAMHIFESNPQSSRNEMIQKFVDELSMSANSAATHCSMCSKAYGGNNHNTVVY